MKESGRTVLWRGLLPVMFSFLVMGFVDIVSISVSYVKKDLLLSDTTVNFLPMMVFIWFAICSIPTGFVMRRIGRKKTVLISAAITFAGMVLPFIDYNYPIMLTAFALLGIGNTILQVSLNPLVSDLVSKSKLTSMLTFGQFIKAISSAVGPVLVAVSAIFLGDWKIVFGLYAIIILLSFLWLASTPIAESDNRGSQSGFSVVLSLLKDPYILLLFSIIVFIVGFEVSLMTTVPKYFVERGLTLEDGSYANTLYFIARTAGTFIGAFILAKTAVKPFFVSTMALALCCCIVFSFVTTPVMLYGSLFVVGLMCANVFAISFSVALQYKSKFTNEISSLMIVGVAGGALLPPIMGIIADNTSQQISLIVPIVALAYILFVASIKLKQTKV